MIDLGHVFLSYASLEAPFALRLAAALKNAGVHLWMDRLDGIRPGQDWRRAIEEAVNSCAGMIAVLSADYVTSNYCRRELARADTMAKPVFPVLLQSVSPDDWPIEVQRTQYIDFRAWPDDRQFAQRLEELLSQVRTRAPDQVGARPDPEQQYLINLIAEFEARKGVLEYVELAGRADTVPAEEIPFRPDPHWADVWGLDGEFVLLEPAGRDRATDRSGTEHSKLRVESLVKVFSDHPRLVLLGQPGAGKTTTLRRLALETARNRQTNPQTAPLPLLIALPSWGSEPTPSDLIRAHWPFHTDPSQALASGDVILFLDGLNEMGAGGSTKAKDLGKWLRGFGGPRRVMLTCRLLDYAGDLELGLPAALVEDLDEPRIKMFAGNYLSEDADSFLRRVIPSRSNSADARHLGGLTRNPYLLTALMLVYKNSKTGDLPLNYGALFHQLAQVLWERERRRRTPGWRPWEEMQPAFARLAFTMIEEDRPTQVQRHYAGQFIGDETLIRAGVSASLLTIEGEEVSFYHQLMQEYFAAAWLDRTGLGGRVKRAGFQYSTAMQTIPFGVRASRWDQVLLALCGITAEPENLVREIAAVNPYLALTCIESGREMGISQPTWKTIIRGFLQEINYRVQTLPEIEEDSKKYRPFSRGYDEADAAMEKYQRIINYTADLIRKLGPRAGLGLVELSDKLTIQPPLVGWNDCAEATAEALDGLGNPEFGGRDRTY